MENDLMLTTLKSNHFMVKNAEETFKEYRLQAFLKSRESDNEVLSATIPILSNDGLKMLEVMVKEKLDETLTEAESRAVFQRTEHGLVLILDVFKHECLERGLDPLWRLSLLLMLSPCYILKKACWKLKGSYFRQQS